MPMFARQRQTAKPLPLTIYGDPVLNDVCAEIPAIDDAIRDLAARMIVTMETNDGIGLAAPQVGRKIRLVALDVPTPKPGDDEELPAFNTPGEALLLPKMPCIVVNPVLSGFSPREGPYNEGCLSIPDVRGQVVRPLECDLQALTLEGEPLNVRCGGLLARCLQHEVDHLDGKLFVDYLSDQAFREVADDLRKLKRQSAGARGKKRRRRR